jgi:predicted amidophosphoribosyltransferase
MLRVEDFDGLRWNLAVGAYESGDYADCIDHLKHVAPGVEKSDIQGRAEYHLGKKKLAQGDLSDAREHFRSSSVMGSPSSVMSLSQERVRLLEARFRVPARSDQSVKGTTAKARVKEIRYLDDNRYAPSVDLVACVAAYRSGYDSERNDELSRLIRMIKNRADKATVRRLGQLISDLVHRRADLLERIDFIVPIPSDSGRAHARGYSISAVLADAVSVRCSIPVQGDALWVDGSVPELRGVPRRTRKGLLAGIYKSGPMDKIEGRHVLVVDDVVTSGATITSAAESLKRSGAATVSAVALAQTESSRW